MLKNPIRQTGKKMVF